MVYWATSWARSTLIALFHCSAYDCFIAFLYVHGSASCTPAHCAYMWLTWVLQYPVQVSTAWTRLYRLSIQRPFITSPNDIRVVNPVKTHYSVDVPMKYPPNELEFYHFCSTTDHSDPKDLFYRRLSNIDSLCYTQQAILIVQDICNHVTFPPLIRWAVIK